MKVSVKLNKEGIKKIRQQIEKELNSQIQMGVSDLRKDSEKFLEIVLKNREELGTDSLRFGLEEFSEIPNIQINARSILKDLKIHGCISDSSNIDVTGKMDIYLTMDGIDYFKDKERKQLEQKSVNTININGSGNNTYVQQETVNSTQTQTITMESIDFEKVAEFVKNVKKYDPMLEAEYGEQAAEVREKLDEISSLVQKKDNPGRIKTLLIELKNLSIGIAGSLIASGISAGINNLLMHWR